MPKIYYKTTWRETLVYLAFWVIVFLAPIISLHMRMQSNRSMPFDWDEVGHAWEVLAIAMGMYFVHNHFIAPLIIYQRRKVLYFAASTFLLFFYLLVMYLARPAEVPKHFRSPHGGPRKEYCVKAGCPKHPVYPRHEEPEFMQPIPIMGPGELMAAICVVLLMGMNLGVKYYFKEEQDAEERQELDKKNLEQRLQYLRYQVNPYFFMNTLNNIHALVDIDPEKAKTTIVELSKMMRYILYEGSNRLIPVQREMQFLNNYVLLMRLRYPDKVSITFDAPSAVPDLLLPPLLLIIFVENAFKHGISYCNDSFINISFRIEGGRLVFKCRNSKNMNRNCEKGGLGLVNVRKRLDLLFAQNYRLDITDGADVYEVTLSLPLAKENVEQANTQ